MKKFKYVLAVLLLGVFALFAFASREQAPLDSNDSELKQEVETLRQQVASQAELISSLLANKESNVNTKPEENESLDQTNTVTAEFDYVKENGGITITKYNGKQASVRRPEKIEDLPVLKIGKNAFADSKIKSVTLPSLCKEIDWFAFYGCYALSTVYVSEKVTQIGYAAFDGCSKPLTIYCPSGSYAERYSQSFGISYSAIN